MIEEHMPQDSELALKYFVSNNPRMDGAKWADALDILLSHDAHCDLTDAIYTDLRPHLPLDAIPWIVPVFLTMLYARKGTAPYAVEVAQQIGRIMGKLDAKRALAR
jgi:hypothetical protein